MIDELVFTGESELDQAAYTSYITALLLIGDAELAEAAVMQGIAQLDTNDPSGEELLLGTIEAAISAPHRHAGHANSPESGLPAELTRIVRLRPAIRYCFVLRVLVGLSREVCARMLGLRPCQVDQAVCSAAQLLANASSAN